MTRLQFVIFNILISVFVFLISPLVQYGIQTPQRIVGAANLHSAIHGRSVHQHSGQVLMPKMHGDYVQVLHLQEPRLQRSELPQPIIFLIEVRHVQTTAGRDSTSL